MLFRPMIEMLRAKQGTALPSARQAEPGQSTQCANRAAFSTTGVKSGIAASRKVTVQLAGRNHFMLIAVPVRSVG